jgi:hypothetical protein
MRMLTLICAAVIAVCGTGRAQNMVDRVSVHFATPVMVGDSMLPAGDCSIQVIRGSSDAVVLELRSGSESLLVPVSRLTDSDAVTNGHASVILGHHNDRYQLVEIVFPDHTAFHVQD